MRTLLVTGAAVVLLGSVALAAETGKDPSAPNAATPNAGTSVPGASRGITAPGLSEIQAREILWNQGYTDITTLAQEQGRWTGKAKKSGADVQFGIDRSGAVMATPAH